MGSKVQVRGMFRILIVMVESSSKLQELETGLIDSVRQRVRSALDDLKELMFQVIMVLKDARSMLLLTHQGIQAPLDSLFDDDGRVVALSQRDEALQPIEAAQSKRDEPFRWAEAVKAPVSTKITAFESVPCTTVELRANYEVVFRLMQGSRWFFP